MEWLNHAILELNLDNGIIEYHCLYKYGVRNYTRKFKDMFGNEQHRKIKCTGLSTGESRTPP